MLDLARTATDDELRFIAGLDYGIDSDQHYVALRKVIFSQSCCFNEEQQWHPYEVVELGAHWLQHGHEREFAICTLLVISAVSSGFDRATDLGQKLSDRAADYDALPPELSSAILSAYTSAGC